MALQTAQTSRFTPVIRYNYDYLCDMETIWSCCIMSKPFGIIGMCRELEGSRVYRWLTSLTWFSDCGFQVLRFASLGGDCKICYRTFNLLWKRPGFLCQNREQNPVQLRTEGLYKNLDRIFQESLSPLRLNFSYFGSQHNCILFSILSILNM